jgi:hypothetical protein
MVSDMTKLTALAIGVATGLVLVIAAKLLTPAPLPHRAQWELYSIQGVYSQIGCPGQHVETISIDGHTFFLGCTQ